MFCCETERQYSTLLNMAFADEAMAKAKDLFFKAKAKASYFQGQGR